MGKWCFLPYDFDTAIGINNEGTLAFSYELEDIDQVAGADVYNGQHSVLWTNLRQAYQDEIKAMYQTLRSTGKLSYADTERRFEEHQARWPEAIFNEDAFFKYLQPLIEDNSAAYLSMLQGSKAEQRKWWLYNRYRYLDSKYNAGDALSDVITVRGYAKADITVTPYADIYASVKYGSYLVQQRALRGNSYTLQCPLDNVNDTEIYIYSASQLKDVGDLSGLMVGYAEFSLATKLQALKLGDASADYSNTNLTDLHLGNNVLLRTLDVRNCPNLTQAVDVSGCTNLEHVYFDGTGITGLLLPVGGILKTLHLPATITNLTIRNQASLTDLSIPSYAGISTLRLENVSSAVDSKAILDAIPANSRVRLIGIDWAAGDADTLMEIITLLDSMRGLDESGNNTDMAQVSGSISVDTVTGAQLAEIAGKYPDIRVAYEHVTSNLYFYNEDGSKLLYTQAIVDGGNGAYSGSTPTKTSTAQYTYSFAGWSKKLGGAADSTALQTVTADRSVYAAFTATVRKYTVYFYNGSTLLQRVDNVPYGGSATYTGDTPVSPDGSAEDYPFEGWSPSPTNITGNTSCYAQYASPLEIKEITDTWEQIIDSVTDGSYATKYSIGNYKPLDLGSQGIINMQIAGKGKDALADGSGTAHISWVGMELLETDHRMNPGLVTNYDEETKAAWVADDSEENVWKSNSQGYDNTAVTAKWNITSDSAGTLSVWYKVDSEIADKLTVKVNGTTVASAISGIRDWKEYTLECSAGDVTAIEATYSKDQNVSSRSDTALVKFRSTGMISITEDIMNVVFKKARDYTEGTGTIGGWEKSEMRAYLKDTIMPLIPDTVRNHIVQVTKTQGAYDVDGKLFTQTTTDDIWIPDFYEVVSTPYLYKTLFPDPASRIKKKVENSSASYWWLRNARSIYQCGCVTSTGSGTSGYNTWSSYGVALGFCI